MIIDGWGQEFETKQQAIAEWTKMYPNFRDVSTLSENLSIPEEILNWIFEDEKRRNDFYKEFSEWLKNDLNDWLDYCWSESEEE